MTNCYSVVDHVDSLVTVYLGSKTTTRSGYTCMNWQLKNPHQHNFIPSDFGPTITTWGELSNYCRDPAHLGHPWCFTTKPGVPFEFCDVPRCDVTTTASDKLTDLPDNRTSSIALLSGTIGGAILLLFLSVLVYVKCVKPLRVKRKKGQLKTPIILRRRGPVAPSNFRPHHPLPRPLQGGPLSQGNPRVIRDVRPSPSAPKKVDKEDSSDDEGQDALERQVNPGAAPALVFKAEKFANADGFVPDENPFQIKVTTTTTTPNSNNPPPFLQLPSPPPLSQGTPATTKAEPAEEGGGTTGGPGAKLAPILSQNVGRGSKKTVAFAEDKPIHSNVSSSSALGPMSSEDTFKSSENSFSGNKTDSLIASKALPPLAGPLSNPNSPRTKHTSLSLPAGHSRHNLDDFKGSLTLSPALQSGSEGGQSRMSGLNNGNTQSSNTGTHLSQVSPLLSSRKKTDNAWNLPKQRPGIGNALMTAEIGDGSSSLPKLAPPSSPQKSSNLPAIGQSPVSPRAVHSVPKLPTLVASSQPAPLERAIILTRPGAGPAARLATQQSLDGGWNLGDGDRASRQRGWAPGEGGLTTRKGVWTTAEGGLTPRQGGQVSESRNPGQGVHRDAKSLLTPRLGGQGGLGMGLGGGGSMRAPLPSLDSPDSHVELPERSGRKAWGQPLPPVGVDGAGDEADPDENERAKGKDADDLDFSDIL